MTGYWTRNHSKKKEVHSRHSALLILTKCFASSLLLHYMKLEESNPKMRKSTFYLVEGIFCKENYTAEALYHPVWQDCLRNAEYR